MWVMCDLDLCSLHKGLIDSQNQAKILEDQSVVHYTCNEDERLLDEYILLLLSRIPPLENF